MRNVYGLSLATVLCLVSISPAQVRTAPAPGARPAAGAAPAANAQAASPDQQIADCLRGGAQNEVALAKFAQERAKSDSVKEFAAMMIKDHGEQVEKLARWAGSGDTARGETKTEVRREVRKEPAEEKARDEKPREKAREDKARDDKAGEARRERAEDRAEDRREARDEAREDRREVREERTTVRNAAAGNRAFNWVTIHKEIGEQCLKSTKEELGRYKGDDFDKAYMGQQIVAHMQMIDKLTVLKNYASAELASQLDKDLEGAEEHLKHAREIMKEQKDQGSKGDDGRDSDK